ncbi:MAG: hypothetical protein HXS50_04670 [Theionarchaea archaeon]|nr:hypothetical protein [Theionarchaea archaeon]
MSRAIHAMSGMVPVEHTRIYSGTTDFNGSEVRYSVHDFRGFNQIFNDTNQCVFMLLTKGDDIVASFSGVPDLFPKRELGSLIDATVTRSGNRTYYSRRSLEEAGSVQIDYLPSGCLVFEEVESDETIEISYRSDAFFTSLNKGGAVQVISIFCDGEPEVLLLNFVV